MKRFPVTLLLAIILALPAGGLAQEPAAATPLSFTLRQAVDIALEKNPGLKQSANQVEIDRINVAQRQANFAPDLTATLSGSERFDKTLDADGSRDHRDYENASGSLGSSLNLFNGFGDVAALRGAGWSLQGRQDTFTRDQQTLVYSTVTAFLQALSDHELIRVRTENLEGNRRLLEQIDALYRAGNRPVSDLYQQQAETANAELDLLIAERNYTVSSRNLFQTIGLPPVTGVVLQAPDVQPLEAALVARQQSPPDMGALMQRIDLQAAERQIKAAGEQVSVARAGYWPTLNLSAVANSDYTSLNRQADFSGQFFDDNAAAAIGLTLSVPIFDRQLTRNQVAQARIQQDNARLSLLQQQLQAETELGQTIDDFLTAQKLIGVTEARLTAAREALAAMEERYRVGAATLVELTQARTSYTSAGYDRVKARYGLITQGVAVAYYQGDGERMQELLAHWENAQ
jgi:outer membrane protein